MITGIDFYDYNERRAMRGAEAAMFRVYYDNGQWDTKWMSRADIVKNISLFPEFCVELNKGLKAYSGEKQ